MGQTMPTRRRDRGDKDVVEDDREDETDCDSFSIMMGSDEDDGNALDDGY